MGWISPPGRRDILLPQVEGTLKPFAHGGKLELHLTESILNFGRNLHAWSQKQG
jgi:hypothetical protein